MIAEILSSCEDRVLTLSLNRPERKNALSFAMYSALADALQAAESDDEIRAVLITGSQGCFCSGNDLQDFVDFDFDLPLAQQPVVRFMRQLAGFSKPVVAAVEGVAIGIGTTLLLHCDLVYGADTAKFQLPFVNLGATPEFGSSFLLPQLLGQAKAAELMLLGETFTAAEALAMQLLNGVESEVEVLVVARQKARQLAQQPPSALRRCKALLRSADKAKLDQLIEKEMTVFAEAIRGPEFREAVTAFMAKRPPDFSRF